MLLRSIPISYVTDNKKQEAEKCMERSRRYILDQFKTKNNLSNIKHSS